MPYKAPSEELALPAAFGKVKEHMEDCLEHAGWLAGPSASSISEFEPSLTDQPKL